MKNMIFIYTNITLQQKEYAFWYIDWHIRVYYILTVEIVTNIIKNTIFCPKGGTIIEGKIYICLWQGNIAI